MNAPRPPFDQRGQDVPWRNALAESMNIIEAATKDGPAPLRFAVKHIIDQIAEFEEIRRVAKKVSLLILLLVLSAPTGSGMDRLAALSMIETGDNDRAVGRAGEISRYQILKREWRSVTNSTRYTDPATARAVTRQLLAAREARFRLLYRRAPTAFEIYALWNAPGQVFKGRLSPVVTGRSHRYANLVALR